ncbi:MAG: ribosome biogenesis GTP-binding protein YihA/YsxC [Alphaproteobacteria bacterium]
MTDVHKETGRLLFARSWDFWRGTPDMAHLPPMEGYEIAFAGRSNVGKSSLINALVNRHDMARTSNTPGRTQELNFFRPGGVEVDTNSLPLVLVDMPGYGFAAAPEQKVRAWTKLIHEFLRGRANLLRVYVLVDSRHGLKPVDATVFDQMDRAAVSYQVVLTKIDQIAPSEIAPLKAAIMKALEKRPAAYPEVLATSSRKAEGMEELRGAIAQVLAERS